jgi:hypothetical protein
MNVLIFFWVNEGKSFDEKHGAHAVIFVQKYVKSGSEKILNATFGFIKFGCIWIHSLPHLLQM